MPVASGGGGGAAGQRDDAAFCSIPRVSQRHVAGQRQVEQARTNRQAPTRAETAAHSTMNDAGSLGPKAPATLSEAAAGRAHAACRRRSNPALALGDSGRIRQSSFLAGGPELACRGHSLAGTRSAHCQPAVRTRWIGVRLLASTMLVSRRGWHPCNRLHPTGVVQSGQQLRSWLLRSLCLASFASSSLPVEDRYWCSRCSSCSNACGI